MLSGGQVPALPRASLDPLATVWEGYQAPAELMDAADWLLEGSPRGECGGQLWGPTGHPPLGGRIGASRGPSGAAGHGRPQRAPATRLRHPAEHLLT